MGEEERPGARCAIVDSSVERLQVKVTGLTDGRYVIACNGCRVPLHATGTEGEYVAGVRFRAWKPPSALHPTIGIHAPLVFDLYRHLERPRHRRVAPAAPTMWPSRRTQLRAFPGQAYEGKRGGTPPRKRRDNDDQFPMTLDLRRAKNGCTEPGNTACSDGSIPQVKRRQPNARRSPITSTSNVRAAKGVNGA